MKSFPWNEREFKELLSDAIKFYWATRNQQAEQQVSIGRIDAGHRNEVTAGKHLDGLAMIIVSTIEAAGIPSDCIWFSKALPIPGYYRAQKKWDVCVVKDTKLIAAIELKSQSGSFGNNFNNRCEEVIGSSRDFWLAFREKYFGTLTSPWLGYCFLLEDSTRSSECVRIADSPIVPNQIFKNTSYKDRYQILCERLLLERDYQAASLIFSQKDGNYYEASTELSMFHFCESLYKHLLVNF